MALIDFDKFLASFITEMKECSQMRNFSIQRCIKKALDDQGLKYKDEKIVRIPHDVEPEFDDEYIQEWSEEDEKMCQNILECLRNGWRKLPADILKYESWLKSRITWKPSNELDEASYQVGIKRVLENPESYGLTKYNWKPSDEQLFILNWLANVKLGDSVVEQDVSKHLNELYKDLKKLREE